MAIPTDYRDRQTNRTGTAAGYSSIVSQAQKVYNAAPEPLRTYDRKPAPDGYLRITPVQEIMIPADYKSRIIRRAVLYALGFVVLAAAVYAIIHVLL